MAAWPLPEIGPHALPGPGEPGSFWEERGDRYHCGVDLYAPPGSPVASIEEGRVLCTGIQTDPSGRPYWQRTYFVCILQGDGYVLRYAELGDLEVGAGDPVAEGQIIGHVGVVIDASRVDRRAPPYIRRLAAGDHFSMLHLEVYRSVLRADPRYSGGNWLDGNRPSFLCDPAVILGTPG
ncbi:MAG: M23 family metallopeptidase [Methanomicrobiaceae archaeon]|nr:M23 family metallopeptidase [Methanomicrobiaceae archaeon]